MLKLKLPIALLNWIEENRGSMSRSAFIVHHMVLIMNNTKMNA